MAGTLGLTTGVARALGPDLIVNGSFEQPHIAPATFAITNSVPGWTLAPGSIGTGIELQNHVAGTPKPPQDQFVELDSNGSTGIFQDVPTTVGTTYVLQFVYSPRPGTAAAENHFSVTAGSQSAVVGPVAGGATTDWQPFSLAFVATSTTSRIQFFDLGPSDGLGGYVDFVSVRAASTCTRTVTGDVVGPVVAAPGETVCITNARVSRGVTVNPGGALVVTSSEISGGINSSGAAFTQICGTQVAAPPGAPDQSIVVTGATGPVLVGNPSGGCPADTISGGLSITADTAGVTFAGNTVSRGAMIDTNTGGPVVVSANSFLTGSLECSGNAPAPTNPSAVNTAAGGTSGQCAGL
ncbi:MAG: DUF642 domain-containing protein [Acidimicrobiales bacterium]